MRRTLSIDNKSITLILALLGALFALLLFLCGKDCTLLPKEYFQAVAQESVSPSIPGVIIFAFMAAIANFWILDLPRYGRIPLVNAVYYSTIILFIPQTVAGIIICSGLVKIVVYRLLSRLAPSIDKCKSGNWITGLFSSYSGSRSETSPLVRETVYSLISFGTGASIYHFIVRKPFSLPLVDSHTSLIILSLVLSLIIILSRIRKIYHTLTRKKDAYELSRDLIFLIAGILFAAVLIKYTVDKQFHIPYFAAKYLFNPTHLTPLLCAAAALLMTLILIAAERLQGEGLEPRTREIILILISAGAVGSLFHVIPKDKSLFQQVNTEFLLQILTFFLCALTVLLLAHFFNVVERIITERIRVSVEYLKRIDLKSLRVHLLMLMPLGLLIATVFQVEPRGLILLFPVYFMYSALRSYGDIHREALSTIEDLAIAFESRDPYTRSHSQNVAHIAGEIAREMFLEEDLIERVISAGKLHDLGKIGISDEILSKGKFESLSFEEYEEIRKHPVLGRQITRSLSLCDEEAKYIYYHHEWFDGSGYPEGKRGTEIPLGARILAVAEAFDYMASHSQYRDPVPLEMILDELRKKRGTQFDPRVVDSLISIVEEKRARL